MKKVKLKKEVVITLTIIIIILLIIFIRKLFIDYSYEVEYEVNGYSIRENYDDEVKMYTFEVTDENVKHTFYYKSKYQKDKKLIYDIEEKELEDEKCLLIGASFELMPFCKTEDEAIDYRITSDAMQKELDVIKTEEILKEYGNYQIYNNLDFNLVIWDYNSFLNITDEIDKTKILSSDSYNIDLAAKVNEYILIPDYDSKYTFNKLYIYNILDGSKEEMKIKYDISFDSYILGTNDDSIYLVDRKNKIEYEIVPSKKKIRKVGTSLKNGTILTSKGFEKISLTKLCSEDMHFWQKEYYKYEIEDNKLYQIAGNSKTRVSNEIVKAIIRVEDDNVLYLVDDTLYLYNLKYGEVKLVSNFEWKFNYENLMFLYIP